jgi:Protein of unknown function (DUF4239)
MIVWIESQQTAVIALLVFGICYALAGIVLLGAVVVSQRPIAAALKATTPVMLTPLGLITGLVIAFLASRVWSNVDHANTYVAQEASAIRQTVLLADQLPEDGRNAVRSAIKRYLEFIETEDWPAMAEGRANLRQPPPGLTDALTALIAIVPVQPGQHVAQERAAVSIEQALEARRNRILISKSVISPLQWIVILVLYLLVLVTIAMVHIDRSVTAGLNLILLATGIAACLVLLMVNDRPFNAGGITIQPDVLREVGHD